MFALPEREILKHINWLLTCYELLLPSSEQCDAGAQIEPVNSEPDAPFMFKVESFSSGIKNRRFRRSLWTLGSEIACRSSVDEPFNVMPPFSVMMSTPSE